MVDEYPYLEFGTEITGRSISQVKFMELGIVLGVTPHVYQDSEGTYVKLDLHPEVSFPSGVANGVPIRSLRSSSTIANVRDGQTLVVGGIITEDEQNAVTKVPGLGDMPIFGNLFKTREKTKFRTELVIFVTPTVHRRPEEITWDQMLDVAGGIHQQELASGDIVGPEARKD
jgi:type II secretory pathway component GspD/PulD (secretin)